ncbi:uncharacterized protein LOC128883807 [Hylaeus volcanicus]|uniref:uncharacterized protein LOC128883807 n=1 Tax=Hylaeus volcanicus TaxID=313075 RepID=UPI0023B7A0E4|nr:uncharacterized protein LOC128883807 [Hylaeus volcanicus]
MSVLSTAAVSSLNDKAKVFIWRNSVLLSFDFSRFLLIKSQLPTSETVKSVLVNSKQSLLDEIKFKFLATCFDRRSCTNLFCGTRRKFNGHDKNITPIYRIETPALNKRLWSEPKNAFNARMKSLTLSTNTLKCLTSSNNMMTSEELTQFSSDENKSILSNNLASLGSFVNLSVSKKAKKKSLDDNVILNDQLNTHMCQNPKITVCKNGSLLPLQYTRRFREKFKQNTSVGNAMISETKTLFLNKLKLPGFFKDKAITTVHTAPILTNTKRDSCDKKTLLNNQLKSFSKAPNVVSSLNKNITSANNSEVSLIKEQDVPCPTTVVFSLSHSEDHVENKKTIESIRYDSLYVNQLKTCMTPDEKAQILYNKYDPLNGFSETRPNEGSDTELHKNLHSNQTVPEKNRQACFAPTCRNSVFFTTEEKRRVKQPRLLKFDSHKTPLPPSQASVLQNINLNFNTQSISLLTRERRSLSLPCGLIESGTITLEKTNCKRWSDVQPLTSYSSFTKILNRNGGNTSIRHVREYASSFSKKKHDVITTDSSPVVNTSFARYPLFSRQRNKGGSFNDFNTSPVSNHLPSKNKRKEIFRPQNHLLPQTNQKKIENWSDKLLSSCESENANSINKTFIRMVPNARSLTKPQISSSNHNNQTMSDERVTSPNLKKTFYNHKVDFYKINKENFALNKNDAFSSKALLSKTDNEGNIFLKHSSMSHQHKSIIQDWGDKLLSSSESEDLNSIDKTASAMSASDRFNENTNLSTLTQQTVDQSHQWAISLVPQESPPRSTNHLFSMIKDNSSINQDRSPSLHKMPSVTHNSKNLLYKPSNMYKPNQRAIDAWCDELVLSEYSENSEIITQGVPMSNEFDVATTNQQIIFVCGKSQNQPNGNFISSIEKQNSPFNVNKQFEPKLKSCSKEKKHVNRFNDEASFISNSKDISDKQSLASNLCDKKTHDEKKKNLFSIYSNNLKSSVQKISLNDPSNAPSTSSHVDPVTKEIVRKFEKTTKLHLPNSSISGNYPISGTLNNTTLHTDISDPVSRKRSSKSYFAESIMHDWSDDFLSSSVSESSELISSKLSPLNENYVLPVTAYVSSATKTNAIPSNEKVLSTVSKQFRSSNVRNTVKCEENHSFDNQSNSIISTKPISHTYITKDFFEKSPLTLEENQKIMQNWSNDLLSSNDTENTECS